jgi:AraC-like DNA-binding protein
MQIDSINHTGLYTEFKPTENLRKYIYCYWATPLPTDILTNQIIIPKEEIVIPDGCIDLLLRTDKGGKWCRSVLVGTMSRGSLVNMEYNSIQTFGIRFYPGGLQAFMNESSHEFTDRMELVDRIGQGVFIRFTEEISNIQGIYNKIRFANQYFTLNMKQSIPWEDKFQNMIYNIYKSKEIIQVKDIAQREVISEKQVTRIFNNRVGVSAKTFMKIIRFQNAIKIINTRKIAKLVDIALEEGYYDQSHFIRDFYEFTGINPSEYIKKMTNM